MIARAETARELEQYICLASVFLLEVTNRPDYTMEDRLELRERVKAVNPDCKFVLEVDETSEPQIAEQVCQAKKERSPTERNQQSERQVMRSIGLWRQSPLKYCGFM